MKKPIKFAKTVFGGWTKFGKDSKPKTPKQQDAANQRQINIHLSRDDSIALLEAKLEIVRSGINDLRSEMRTVRSGMRTARSELERTQSELIVHRAQLDFPRPQQIRVVVTFNLVVPRNPMSTVPETAT